MKLTVILITWNSVCYIEECINSLLLSVSNINSEIIVVDNGSTDETLDLLSNYSSQITLLRNDTNQGVGAARNKAIKKAQGEYIWILDIDTIVNKNAIEQMLAYIESNKNCGLCACKLVSESGEVQDSCRKYPLIKYKIMNVLSSKLGNISFLGTLKRYVDRKNSTQFYAESLAGNEPFTVEYVIGACQLTKKSLIEKVGYIDDNIFYGPEDADLCIRISRLGYSIACLPSVSIIHHYNRVTNRSFFSKLTLMHIRGLIYFYKKHSF